MSTKRAQKPKANKHSYESPNFIHTVREHSRSSIAEPHRNRTKYRRVDAKRAMQRGEW
jgi:hypothetical protein